ncbi:MAG: flavodoxin domain-containing protein [Tissierellia bacterium]|nr:flavodoxin domain-containing protein [Tissierellia bacterium]
MAIIVNSRYGSTKKYAQWLQEKTKGDLIDFKDFRPRKLLDYSIIVFCAGVYTSGIANLSTLDRSMKVLKEKRVAVFCVGASPYVKEAFYSLYRKHFDGNLKDVPAFYGRGAWDRNKLKFKDRTLCRLLAKKLEKKDEKLYLPWEKDFISFYDKVCDWKDPKYLDPLLEWMEEDPYPTEEDYKNMMNLENF